MEVRMAAERVLRLKSLPNRELLFDVSADAVGTFIPYCGIVVKLTKAAISLKQD